MENIKRLVYGFFANGFSFQGAMNHDFSKMSIILPNIEKPRKVYQTSKGRYIIRNGKRIYFFYYTNGGTRK